MAKRIDNNSQPGRDLPDARLRGQDEKKLYLPLGMLLTALAVWFLLPWYMSIQLKSLLHAQGFNTVSIGHTHLGLRGVEFRDIKLDKEGNSSIAMIGTPVSFGWPDDIYVSGMTLSGDTGAGGVPVIDGWTPRALDFPASVQSLFIENSKLDLTTPAGGLTILIKGQMAAPDKKSRQIDAVLSGNQNQCSFETRWSATWYSNDKWQTRGEIGDMRLRLAHFNAARIAGWLSLRTPTDQEMQQDSMKSGKGANVIMDGKITAGLASMGPAFLNDMSVTFSGPPRNFDMIVEGMPQDQRDMRLKADLKQDGGSGALDATIRAATLDHLFGFLQNVRAGLEANPAIIDKPLSGLLLTQGNIDRINRALQDTRYQAVTLSLTGPADNLGGIITAEIPTTQGGITRRTVNLDPSAQ